MKRRNIRSVGINLLGYTIIEAMIFLTVSGALLVSTMALFSGKDEKTRFTQSVATFEQDLQDLMNDISTGFFPSASDFSCTPDGNGTVTFSGTAQEQGKNSGCTFVGKTVELNGDQYNAYTMVGIAKKTDGTLPASMGDLGVKLLLGYPPNPGIVETNSIEGGIQITKIVNASPPNTEYKGLSIISDFAQVATGDGSVSGNAARVTLYGYSGDFTTTEAIPGSSFAALANGAVICLQEAGGGRKAALIVGTSGHLSIEREIDSERTECVV